MRPALLIATIVTLLGATAATAEPIPPEDVALQLDLRSMADGAAAAHVAQTWTGEDARAFRASLDVYFGAADGMLTEDELARIAAATREDMVGETLPWVMSGGEAWTVSEALISFEGAEGRTSSTAPVTMRHTIDLAASESAEEITLAPPWDAQLDVVPPEGKVVADGAPAGLVAGEATTLRLTEASAPVASSPLVIALLATLGALLLGLAAAALVVSRRMRAARGRAAR